MNALDKIENQSLASRILKGILRTGRIANAYLFIGPPGTGKRLASIQFAKALNCENEGCEECDTCIKIREISHPDVHLIAPEPDKESISIDQMRNMQKEAYLKPFMARFKVYIIEEAQRMLEAASNSLLKILEEPPLNTVFILTTSSPQEILPTIVSRCQTVRFTQYFKPMKKNLEIEEKILPLINANEISRILKDVKNIAGDRAEAVSTLDFLVSWYRDVLLMKERDEKCAGFGEFFLVDALEKILWARHLIARNVSPRLVLETLFLKIGEKNA